MSPRWRKRLWSLLAVAYLAYAIFVISGAVMLHHVTQGVLLLCLISFCIDRALEAMTEERLENINGK